MTLKLQTRRLTRDKLAAFLTSHEAIKAFEALTTDVGETIGQAIDASTAAADAAMLAAQTAQVLADEVATLLATQRSNNATISALQKRVDDLEALLLTA